MTKGKCPKVSGNTPRLSSCSQPSLFRKIPSMSAHLFTCPLPHIHPQPGSSKHSTSLGLIMLFKYGATNLPVEVEELPVCTQMIHSLLAPQVIRVRSKRSGPRCGPPLPRHVTSSTFLTPLTLSFPTFQTMVFYLQEYYKD